MSAPAGRTAAAIQARRGNTEAMLRQVNTTLRAMRRERARITTAAVARRAGVSRTFLYQNPHARALINAAVAQATGQHDLDRAEQAAHAEASWRQRALNAEDALKHAYAEITSQRTSIGELLGKIRDLELGLPEDGVQQVLTENASLKKKVRELARENNQRAERLTTARQNNRFLDQRIANLEAGLLPEPPALHSSTPTG